jgi:hydrogenase maturation factor HypE
MQDMTRDELRKCALDHRADLEDRRAAAAAMALADDGDVASVWDYVAGRTNEIAAVNRALQHLLT